MTPEPDDYESLFRIDGKPILPPVITEQRRIELQRYKLQAIDLENRLRANRREKQQNSAESEILENVDGFVSKQSDEFSFSTEKSGNDMVGESVEQIEGIENLSLVDSSLVSGEKFSIEDTKFEANDSPRSLHLDINAIKVANVPSDMLSPSYSLHSSPSLGALNDSKNQTLYLTPFSPSPEPNINARKLIRSNSYTLDTPSPMLLQLMEANGINTNEPEPPKPTATSQPTLSVKDKLPPVKQAWSAGTSKIAVKRSPSMSDVKMTKAATARKTISPTSTVREPLKKEPAKTKATFLHRKCASARSQESVLRSIYDSGLSSRSSSAPKPKKLSPSSTATNGKLTARVEKPATKPIAAPAKSTVDFQHILKMIEEQHSIQMKALIERQREEQKRMQEEFARQQETLVKQISHLILPASNSAEYSVSSILSKPVSRNNSVDSPKINNNTAGYGSTDNEDMTSITGRDHNGNQWSRSQYIRKHPTPESLKCMRRLVYYDDNQMVSSDLCESKKPQYHETSPSSSDESELFQIQNNAATVITAYAKGYLTRRLFKTVKVQNIVKTIKDTLLFILDIHFENPIENDTPADLKLKTHLIQQLTSACYSLHNIFVNYSVTERLDMIARDREWLQAKFNRSKLSESFSNQQHKRMILNGHIPSARTEKMLT